MRQTICHLNNYGKNKISGSGYKLVGTCRACSHCLLKRDMEYFFFHYKAVSPYFSVLHRCWVHDFSSCPWRSLQTESGMLQWHATTIYHDDCGMKLPTDGACIELQEEPTLRTCYHIRKTCTFRDRFITNYAFLCITLLMFIWLSCHYEPIYAW